MKRRKANLDLHDQIPSKKIRQSRQIIDDNVCPDFSNSQWKKIGKISQLMIYPIKSSTDEVYCQSCKFFDYGMCQQLNDTYFFDGMFIVYNRMNDKFEDAIKYPLLQSTAVDVIGSHHVSLNIYEEDTIGIIFDTNLNRSGLYIFRKDSWNSVPNLYCDTNEEVNEWIKSAIDADFYNEGEHDVTLVQYIPRDWASTQEIKNNWFDFVEGYETMEQDSTGRLITLPRFVLMTLQTHTKLRENFAIISPNVIIETYEPINPFEEKNWNWIKFGEKVVLKNVKPVPRDYLNEELQHLGIYCGLITTNNEDVEIGDDVFIHV